MRVATLAAGTGMACLLFSLACASPAAAQDAASAMADTSACSAFTKPNSEGVPVLRAVCGESGVLIGQVDDYQAIGVAGSGAVLIDTTWQENRRLWLVSPDASGEPVLEEIGGSVAQAAGRGATQELAGLAIDLSSVATGGPIKVTPVEGATSAPSGAVDVATIVATAGSMRMTPSGSAQ